jgi:hypothetical protein
MRPNIKPRWPALLVLAVTLIVYLSIPTRVYYGDGIGFADDIEAGRASPELLFQPNHLLYDSVGYAIWTAVRVVHPNARALYVLQGMDSFFGAASAALLCCILIELFESAYIAVWLSFGFAFTATWWKFSTDADSYVASTFFLIASLLFLLPWRKSRPGTLALTHSTAMLLHQLALFFFPACLIALWYQTRDYPLKKRFTILTHYTILTGCITIAAYGFAFHFSQGTGNLSSFARWISSHSYDSAFSFEVGRNIFTSLAGNVKLFVGGRVPFIRETWGAFIAFSAVAAIGLFAVMSWRLTQHGVPVLRRPKRKYAPIVVFSIVWICVYVVFLVFWLPQNTFYRLFYLPAFILLAGGFIADLKTRNSSALAFCVGVLFFVNLGFSIYPAAQPELNRTELFARSMHDVWEPGTTVYGNVYSGENLTIKYFNPQVTWSKLWHRAPIEDLESRLQYTHASGRTIWFDVAELERLAKENPSFRNWLKDHCRLGETYQFKNSNDFDGFVQLLPLN